MDITPKITLCMIVKNEDTFLEKCLSSVQNFVNEIIIVDTGSTDQTIEIAKQFHAKIYHYQWDNHFANARNRGLTKATGEWILWLDADECLDVKDPEKHKIAIKKKTANILSLPITNLIGNHVSDSNQATYTHYQPRLFRNHRGIRFIHRIHETLDGDTKQMTADTLNLPILHYGYIREVTIQKNKSSRNKKLLELERSKSQHSPWIEYHLASEYYRNREYNQAIKYVNQSILNFLLTGQKPPSVLYKLKYDMLIQTNSLDQALPGIEKALLLYPDYVDLHFYKGLILFQQANFQAAKDCFEKCLELGENHPDHLVLKGVGSFRAVQYRNACSDELKESNEGGAP